MADFVDGEGYVSIVRQIRKGRPSPAYRAYVPIANTNLEVLEVYLRYYGGKVYRRHDKRRDAMGRKWTDAFTWYCPISSTKQLLLDLRPYLRIKSKQAEIVLEFMDNKKAFARGKRRGKGGSSPLTQEETQFRERLRRQVMLLNRKGKFSRSNGGGG